MKAEQKNRKKDTNKDTNKEKKILYIVCLVCIVMTYSRYLPYLMDIYVLRPETPFFRALYELMLNETYRGEGVLIGFVLVVLCLLVNNIGAGVLIESVLLFALSHASYIKYLNRRELFRIDDLKLTEAAGMAAQYIRFTADGYLLMLAGFMAALCAAGFLLEKTCSKYSVISRRMKLILAAPVFACGILYFGHFIKTQHAMENLQNRTIFSEENRQNVLFRFLDNNSFSGISAEDAGEGYLFFEEFEEEQIGRADEADYPNVIVIMNESWWNTDNLPEGKAEFSMNPMEPYYELEEICSSGWLTSNICGGGTVSSEGEFLTGFNTKYFVTDSNFYSATLTRKLPSVADYFNALGYDTIAVHPYYGDFYDRSTVYQKMGFDKMIFDEEMDYREIYSRYISDESLILQIQKEFEEKRAERAFIWAVSIANHRRTLSYHIDPVEDYPYPIQAALKEGEFPNDEEKDNFINYINGIYYAGLAFQELAEYFADREEPVVLAMFGDHIPNYSSDTMKALGVDVSDTQEETLRRIYSVPVLVWTNCTDEKLVFSGENINYLPEILFDYAGLPDAAMMKILRAERTGFRTNTRYLAADSEGNVARQCSPEQLALLNYFQAVQYDVLFGDNGGADLWRPKRGGSN